MMACPTCGTELRPSARFCDECGSPVTATPKHAEYKQVTVLFADVVHSMDLAAAVGAERLREIMAAVVGVSSAVIQHYGGTVDKFTGDGIMAVFGAPAALEDHALRACLAALALQRDSESLSAEVQLRDGVPLQLRIGLNSGQVIAGDSGSGAFGYTAIGEQVGMAQRMESVAPPGGVMLSQSTARLVERSVVVAAPEQVHIKGVDDPVPSYRLLATAVEHDYGRRTDPTLVGRTWELNAIAGLLDEAIAGRGSVVDVVGPPGIGKSRMVGESVALATARGMGVFSTYCESHASDIPFHVVVPLLRTGFGVNGIDDASARLRVRELAPGADPEDLLLLDDVLGIAEPSAALPTVEADARRRRLTAVVNAVSLSRREPGLYVVEDAHWIDEVSESMLADFLAVVSQTHSVMLITYRPEYAGALAGVSGAQTIALRPLTDVQISALVDELLGPDPSVRGLAGDIAQRAAGNPFFAEEIVRDLAERGALRGRRGAYRADGDIAGFTVPATLQATIAARIDRLDSAAKETLSAAAVIGLRFGPDLLTALGATPETGPLIAAELVDQVMFTPRAEYAFRHPLVRMVAYESQLKSDRAELHRRLAAAIEQRDPQFAQENAALIAEHHESAGDLHAAFGWHMRAGTWLTNRDIAAARLSWHRARQVADRLHGEDPGRAAMRIAPRTLLCLSTWRAGGTVADTGFEELRELASAAGDKVSLAIGMAGQASSLLTHGRYRESSWLASELLGLTESIGDPVLELSLLYVVLGAKFQVGEMTEVIRAANRMIDLADGDAGRGNLIIGSPLVTAFMLRGLAGAALGRRGWQSDIDRATTMVREFDPTTRAMMHLYRCMALPGGLLLPDAMALQETAETLGVAERSGDDLALDAARFARGVTLVECGGPHRRDGFELLAQARDAAAQGRFSVAAISGVDVQAAKEMVRTGDLDGAIALSRMVVDGEFEAASVVARVVATEVLVEALLQRGSDADLGEADAAIDRLVAAPTEPGFVLHDVPLLRLRALLARARGDEAGYRDFVDRYRARATEVGFEGHMAIANSMS